MDQREQVPDRAVADSAWRDAILAELGGERTAEALRWLLEEGVALPVACGPEDLARSAPPLPMRPGGSPWQIRLDLDARRGPGLETALREADALGADALGVALDPADTPGVDRLAELAGTWPRLRHFHVGGHGPALITLLDRQGALPADGTSDLDPAALLLRHGRVDAEALYERARHFPGNSAVVDARFRPFCADGLTAHRVGATDATELAIQLASVSAWLSALAVDRGIPAGHVAACLHIHASAGPRFFPTVARLRALRAGVAQVCEAFGVPMDAAWSIPVHVRTSPRWITAYDPYGNLVRATTAAAAAVIGGCDSLAVTPHDAVTGESARGHRLGTGIQLLLRDEGLLHAVMDPSAGSWYIESLTDRIGSAAWERFQEIEREGGLLAALGSGSLAARLRDEGERDQAAVNTRDRVLVGVNRYAAATEPHPGAPVAEPPMDAVLPFVPSDAPGPLAPTDRPSARLEALRAALHPESLHGHTHATALLLALDRSGWTRSRTAFASDFLACAGVRTEGPVPCPDDASVSEAVRASGSPIVVLCGPDEAYPAAGRAARAALGDRTPNLTLVAAGRPPDDTAAAWHVDACIHRQTPLLEGITDILVSAGLRFDEGMR